MAFSSFVGCRVDQVRGKSDVAAGQICPGLNYVVAPFKDSFSLFPPTVSAFFVILSEFYSTVKFKHRWIYSCVTIWKD